MPPEQDRHVQVPFRTISLEYRHNMLLCSRKGQGLLITSHVGVVALGAGLYSGAGGGEGVVHEGKCYFGLAFYGGHIR